jgi:hypothetical protein
MQIKEVHLPKKIKETSGLEYIGENFLTHNDSGDESRLYEFNKDGVLLKSTRIYSISNVDWEDITSDEENYYIADTGNNYATRKNLRVYILNKNLNLVNSISIRYKEQKFFERLELNTFDAEAIVSINNSLMLFSKNRKNLSTEIYVFSKSPGSYELIASNSLNVNSLITGADYDSKIELLALTGYNFQGEQFLYTCSNFKIENIEELKFEKHKIPVKKAQIEAIKIIDKNSFWITSEAEKNQFPRLFKIIL